MLLSRFWYVILAILATLGLMAAMVASNVVNEQSRDAIEDDLARDRTQVEQTLRIEARTRIDALAPIAANTDVRRVLRQASRRSAGANVPEELATSLATKLAELNGQLAGLRGDLLFALDQSGYVVAAVAPGRIPAGAGLGQFPLVTRALQGYVRDDVWVYNDGLYRMAARPVIEGGEYVGAVVHGKRFDDDLAQLLSNRLGGATVAFYVGTEVKAGYMPSDVPAAPRRDELGAPLAEVLEDEKLRAGERTEPAALPTGGLAVYSLVTGAAHGVNAGYAIARPLPQLQQPWDLVLSAPEAQWIAVLKLWWLWAILVGLIAVAMFSVWLERDRPLGKMRRAASSLTGEGSRLTITDFGGPLRKIAEDVNAALDRVAESGGAAGPKRKAANLDEILGPASDSAQPAFFGFAQQDADNVDLPEVPPAEPSAASPSQEERETPPVQPPAGAEAAKAPPSPPKPPAASAPVAPPKPPAPPAPPPVKAEPAEPAESAEPEAPTAKRPAPSAEKPKVTTAQRRNLKRTLLGVPPPEDEDDDEGATMVARVPQELLAQSASHHTGDDEDAHFREVYQKFVDTKKQCGESTVGLTFEKFAVTLRKNRDQIISRHGARRVRFTVYVKAGKAALKATPIRE